MHMSTLQPCVGYDTCICYCSSDVMALETSTSIDGASAVAIGGMFEAISDGQGARFSPGMPPLHVSGGQVVHKKHTFMHMLFETLISSQCLLAT